MDRSTRAFQKMSYMVYGYAVKDEWLYSYAIHKGAVLRGNSKWDKENVIFAGISTLMCDAGVYGEANNVASSLSPPTILETAWWKYHHPRRGRNWRNSCIRKRSQNGVVMFERLTVTVCILILPPLSSSDTVLFSRTSWRCSVDCTYTLLYFPFSFYLLRQHLSCVHVIATNFNVSSS